MKLILASASPRRQELISLISEDVICAPSGVEEIIPDDIPTHEIPLCLAAQKAKAVAEKYPDYVVIGCDTGVILGEKILGKPKDKEDARRMMNALSGKTHKVITACTLIKGERKRSFSSVTEVEFYPLSEEEIEAYVNSGDCYDKAGAYGIQSGGALFVKEIRGDYLTVVGLPVARLKRELDAFMAEE